MKTTSVIMTTLLALLALSACSSDDADAGGGSVQLTLSFGMPPGMADAMLSEVTVWLTDINTGAVNTVASPPMSGLSATFSVQPGFYDIHVEALSTYTDSLRRVFTDTVKADFLRQQLTNGQAFLSVKLFTTAVHEDERGPHDSYTGLVLAEIFCAGTASPQGSYYYADKYFVIYNNTADTLYADSVALAESDFLTVMKEEYTPDLMDSWFAVGALYMIPGSGHDVAVAPGGRLLLVDNALNHTNANPNSWNLTSADYEWYDESTNPEYTDIDNPNVANLDRIYSKTLTVWSPHTQGFKSYALVRLKCDKITFLTDYTYDYAYHLVGQTGEADMTGSCYKVPNEWVIDAVNLSCQPMFQWLVTAPELDRGWTYCANFGWDDSRYGKSVRRKVKETDGRRAVLQDTNNSSDDFEARAEADPFHVFQ